MEWETEWDEGAVKGQVPTLHGNSVTSREGAQLDRKVEKTHTVHSYHVKSGQ